MAGPSISLWAYPWDLLDEGVEAALDSIAGLGMTSLSLATSYHTVEHLRPKARGSKYFVAPDAALYFRPTLELYADTPLKPRVSPLVTNSVGPLHEIGTACRQRGLSLTSWTVCLHNLTLGSQHPECCQTNVFGDAFTSHLDPTNPAVRAYLVALCRDLAATGLVDRLQLESIGFGGRPHFHAHPKVGLDLGPAGWFLFALPASPSARALGERAGIDVERLLAAVRETLASCFQTGQPLPGDPATWAAELPGLADYARALQRSITDLVGEIHAAAGLPISVIAMGDVWTSFCDAREIARIAEDLVTLAYTPSPDQVVAQLTTLAEAASVGADRVVVGLQAYGTAAPDRETLLACVDRALEAGARRFSFYNYGIMPPAHLPWLRDAAALIRQRAGDHDGMV